MTILSALLLGIVQGVTQFLPVPSAGHFALISELFSTGSITDNYPYIEAFMHIGGLAALIIVFWSELSGMLIGMLGMANLGPDGGRQKKLFRSARLMLMTLAATVPLALALPLGQKMQVLTQSGLFVGAMFIATGCIMFISDKFFEGGKNEGNMSVLDAVIIGICQLAGVIPGVSRMAVTYTAGVAAGLKRSFAVKFAYITCVPASIAVIIALFVSNSQAVFNFADMPIYIVSLIGTMVAGIAVMLIMKHFFEFIKFSMFGLYCLVAGAISIILTLIF